MQGEKEFNSQLSLRILLWGEDALSPPAQIRQFFGAGHYETLSAISGAEEQQEKLVPCLEPRQREHRQAPTEGNAQPCVPARCLGCGNEPGPMGMLCPTTF